MENMQLLCLFLIGYTLLFRYSNGFLLQQNTSASNANFVSHSELYEAKHNLQHSVNDLRTDTENDLKLLASQLQRELNVLNAKLEAMEQRNDSTCLDCELKYKQLEEKYAKIVSDFDLMKENVVKPLVSEVTIIKNKTITMENEIHNITGLKPVKNMQTVTALQQNVSQIDMAVKQLSLNQQARAQDFLALYKQTENLEKDTSRQKEAIHSLQTSLNTSTTNLKDELDRQVALLWSGVNASTKELNHGFNALREKVAVTVCATTGTYRDSTKVPFTEIKSQSGPIDTNALRNGDFKCPSAGLYIVSFTLMSSTSGANFYIFKNDNRVFYHYISGDDHYDSGTSVVALELNVNDTVSVKPSGSLYIDHNGSCLTIIKIK